MKQQCPENHMKHTNMMWCSFYLYVCV